MIIKIGTESDKIIDFMSTIPNVGTNDILKELDKNYKIFISELLVSF